MTQQKKMIQAERIPMEDAIKMIEDKRKNTI